jgi:hypothetical protein
MARVRSKSLIRDIRGVKKAYSVTKKGVAEQGLCECASCVNARFDDQGSRVDLAITFIKEGGRFDHFWKRLVLIVHGVHGKCRRKAAHLMKQDGAALMRKGDGGGKR